MPEHDRFLVTGATGRVGHHVLRGLRALGAPALGTTAHRPGPGLAVLDWQRGAWPDDLLHGVRGVFLMVPEQLPDASVAVHRFLDQAVAAGVERLVLLSALGVEVAGEQTGMSAIERAARTSGLRLTILRPNTLMHTFRDGAWGAEIQRRGEFLAPIGDARVSFVAAEDVAAAAVAALTAAGPTLPEPVLTGPAALDLHEVAAEIARAAGRPVRYRPVDPADYAAHLRAAGLPPPLVSLLQVFMTALASGAHALVRDDLRRLTGAAPRSFAEFAAATAWG